MIVEECKIYKGFVAVLLLIILFSCTDETMISGNWKEPIFLLGI